MNVKHGACYLLACEFAVFTSNWLLVSTKTVFFWHLLDLLICAERLIRFFQQTLLPSVPLPINCLNYSVLRSFIMPCVNRSLLGVRSLPTRPAKEVAGRAWLNYLKRLYIVFCTIHDACLLSLSCKPFSQMWCV